MELKYIIRIALVALVIASVFGAFLKLFGLSAEVVRFETPYCGVAVYFTILHKLVVPTPKP